MSKIYNCLVELENGKVKNSRIFYANNELMLDEILTSLLKEYKNSDTYNNMIKTIHTYIDSNTVKNKTFRIGKYVIKF